MLQTLVKRRGVAAQCKTSGLYHSTSNHSFYFTPFRCHFPFSPAFCMSLSVTYFWPALPWEYTGFNVTFPSLFCSILCTASNPTGSISETEPLVCVGSFILKIPWISYVLLVSDFLPSSPALCSLLKNRPGTMGTLIKYTRKHCVELARSASVATSEPSKVSFPHCGFYFLPLLISPRFCDCLAPLPPTCNSSVVISCASLTVLFLAFFVLLLDLCIIASYFQPACFCALLFAVCKFY